MNKILFFISSIALVACSGGSFKNNTAETLSVGDVELEAGACKSFGGGLFGFGSDFPVKVTTGDNSTISITYDEGLDEDNLAVGHYVIESAGKVVSTEESCEEEVTADETAEEATAGETEEATADAETSNAPDDGTRGTADETCTAPSCDDKE